MSKKEKRGRKALPPDKKKPPQPTVKINVALYPFVKLLKREFKAKRIDAEKLQALTNVLLDGKSSPLIEEPTAVGTNDAIEAPHQAE